MITSSWNDQRKLHRADRIMSLEGRKHFNGVKFQWVELVERISQWGKESREDREEECEQKEKKEKGRI